jgi:hypothetical protein
MTRLLQAILNWCRHCKGISFHLKHAHCCKGSAQIDRQNETEERVIEGAQIRMRDHSGTAGIVDQGVEPAFRRPD